MLTTLVRFLANKPKPRLPRVTDPSQERVGVADVLRSVLRQHGPITVSDCWKYAKDEGVKSKRQMKIMLRWLRARRDLHVRCQQLAGEKGSSHSREFLFSLATKKSLNADASVSETRHED
eukprot:TRINITY_DN5910_c0_g2_i2.p1 TRINITY_DN5910_c0_g2~~TRINITY_DN5910_c0_g2_i2.p1  ORF type:complete len:120 (+),score=10.65 TRINITY_DN5910_c0_g2_i2:55-414(+)